MFQYAPHVAAPLQSDGISKKTDSDRIPRGLCGVFRPGGKRVQPGYADQCKQKRGCFIKDCFYACCTHRAATMTSLYTIAVHKTSDSRFVVPISESCFVSSFWKKPMQNTAMSNIILPWGTFSVNRGCNESFQYFTFHFTLRGALGRNGLLYIQTVEKLL